MATIVFRMNVSLDGYVDHDAMEPGPTVFRHWTERVGGVTGAVYGRGVYDLMRYWDEDRPEWTADHHAFAAAWRGQRKWVVSRSATTVGPGATLVADGAEALVRRLKADLPGEIAVSGPVLAGSLTDAGLIDLYQLYVHPAVLGRGRPFFTGPRPPLRFVACDPIGDGVIRLTYAAA